MAEAHLPHERMLVFLRMNPSFTYFCLSFELFGYTVAMIRPHVEVSDRLFILRVGPGWIEVDHFTEEAPFDGIDYEFIVLRLETSA